MLKTKICELFGIEYPIISAGMGGVALAELAGAVSEAGGLGTIGLVGFGPEALGKEIAAARQLTTKPLAGNLIVPFLRPGLVEAVVQTPIQALTFFWGDARQHAESIGLAHKSGIKVIWQCGSAEEARWAKEARADAVIAQGFEAGGHVRGMTTSITLIPEVRDAIGDLPVIAAGGLADGRGLAAALALGADGAVFGTRFLATREARAASSYKGSVVQSNAINTLYTTLYDIGWPDAPHRVLRTPLVDRWEAAGRPESGRRPGEGEIRATTRRPDFEIPLVNYTVSPPTDYTEGDIGGMPLYAGQSCSLVREIVPAGELVRRIAAEACAVIADRLAPLAR
jgi:nitronate monooxygenase